MSTCYVIFNEDTTVTTTDLSPGDVSENYTYIQTRDTDQGPIQYYAHKSCATLYKQALINKVLV